MKPIAGSIAHRHRIDVLDETPHPDGLMTGIGTVIPAKESRDEYFRSAGFISLMYLQGSFSSRYIQ